MTIIHLQTQIPLKELLDSLQQLNIDELEQVARTTAILRAQQFAAHLPQAEAALLVQINQGVIPPDVRQRCAALTAKSRQVFLTPTEEAELAGLVDEIELLNAQRLALLSQLATLRQTSLTAVMDDLDIRPLSYE